MSWTKIHGDELQRLQTRLDMPPQSTILEASSLRTPFYHNGELVKMNDGTGTMFMVAAGPGVFVSVMVVLLCLRAARLRPRGAKGTGTIGRRRS